MPVVIEHFVELLKATAKMIKVSTPGERFAIWHWYGRFTQGHYRPDREGKVPNNHNPKSAEIECRLQWMKIKEKLFHLIYDERGDNITTIINDGSGCIIKIIILIITT